MSVPIFSIEMYRKRQRSDLRYKKLNSYEVAKC